MNRCEKLVPNLLVIVHNSYIYSLRHGKKQEGFEREVWSVVNRNIVYGNAIYNT